MSERTLAIWIWVRTVPMHAAESRRHEIIINRQFYVYIGCTLHTPIDELKSLTIDY